MKAEKTPSGMWRVRVPIDPGPDGKRHWKSITRPTRKEALMAADKKRPAASGRLSNSELIGNIKLLKLWGVL